jgi:spore coat protein A
MNLSRRSLLKAGALTGASMAVPFEWLSGASPGRGATSSDKLQKFIQPLRRPAADIPLAAPDTAAQKWWQPGVSHYTIDIGQFEDQLHPSLPNATRLWGFGQNGNFKHLGGIIAAKRGSPVQVTFRNNLPATHILPVDRSIMGAEDQDNRADVHLHGGFVPWTSDGGPFAWWDPDGHTGPSFLNNAVLGVPHPPRNQAEYYYPNDQGSRLEWYHDHAIGITRLNAYAGIASAYVIFDDYELSLVSDSSLPGPLDPRTVYLVFQDKSFVPTNIATVDPSWPGIMPASRPGDLWYAHVYDPDRYALDPDQPAGPPPDPSCVPEFFGDTMLVNGTVFPFLEVEQRQYRFRLLNACQARFLNPRLVYASGPKGPNNAEPNTSRRGPAFVQFGSEGGFLPAPTMLNGPGQPLLLLAPAERADLIVDFRDVEAGSTLILYSDAPAPYPMGDDRNDYFPGNPSTPSSTAGFGPNTRTLLQIRVKARVGAADAPVTLPPILTPTDPFLIAQTPGHPTDIPTGVPVRRLTLDEESDEHGRLIQFLGTDQPVVAPDEFGRMYVDYPTEIVRAGSTEVWEIVNNTGDTHPIHFHLVNAQVLSRQPFDSEGYTGGAPALTGAATGPDRNELGWKETVRMNPGEVTRVLMKFDLPTVPFAVPASPRLAKDYHVKGGAEYVWHCHILEHEEHDMMRPLVVV